MSKTTRLLLLDLRSIEEMFALLVLVLVLTGCAGAQKLPTSSLVTLLPDATHPETLMFAPEDNVLTTHRGIEVRLIYESDVQTEILAKPGLRFSAPGHPDQYTLGLGRFYVFGQAVFVERYWPGHFEQPKLVVKLQPNSPEVAKLEWDEAVDLVVQEVKKRGFGFKGYASEDHYSKDKIRVYFELLEEDHLLQVDIDRFSAEMVFEVFYGYEDSIFIVEWSTSWLPKLSRLIRRVENIRGQPNPIALELILECLNEAGEVRLVQSADGKRLFEWGCVEEVLDYFPTGAFELHLTGQFESTYVREFHGGKYEGAVSLKRIIVHKDLFTLRAQNAALEQEMRREVRRAYVPLVECGRLIPEESNHALIRFSIQASGDVEVDDQSVETPAHECLAKVVSTRWKFSPRKEEVWQSFHLRAQSVYRLDHPF